jgi:hypothetical protein
MTESTVDDVNDVAANETYAEHKGGYVHVFLGGYPEDGFDAAHAHGLADEIGRLTAPLGWFVAKREIKRYDQAFGEVDEDPDAGSPQNMIFIDLFPMIGERQVVPDAVWHLSPSSNRASILDNGLLPRNGGNDHISTVGRRVYVCMVHVGIQDVRDDLLTHRGWTDLDLWRIDTASIPDHDWRVDVETERTGAWTSGAIPPTALVLEMPSPRKEAA